jgi:dihydrofolate synthase/folylpolyglutamate synthase
MSVAAEIRDRDAALDYLFGRIDYERTRAIPYRSRGFKLDRMRRLVEYLGNPQDALRIVHVAGTKGKGSTSAMVASVLSESGYRTGLYMSPHLDRPEQRLVIDGQPCDADQLVELVRRVQPAVARLDREASADPHDEGPTYFEITTAMAMLHFAGQRVDAAVLEVGLGGRLDSTNVCSPAVCAITSISYDHTRTLGDTLAEIAVEKAGIIKPGIPVVSGVTQDEPRVQIERIARERGCRLIQAGRDFEYRYRPPRLAAREGGPPAARDVDPRPSIDYWASLRGRRHDWPDVRIGLVGRHQGANAAVGLTVLELLREQSWSIPEDATRRGLARVRCPARVEILSQHPTVIVDAAHNAASVAALTEVLDESFSATSPVDEPSTSNDRGSRTLVFATSQGKDAAGMLRLLVPRFDRILLTRYLNNPRSVPPEELLQIAEEIAGDTDAGDGNGRPRSGRPSISICPDPASSHRRLISDVAHDQLICVTGSFFIAAEMRPLLQKSP